MDLDKTFPDDDLCFCIDLIGCFKYLLGNAFFLNDVHSMLNSIKTFR